MHLKEQFNYKYSITPVFVKHFKNTVLGANLSNTAHKDDVLEKKCPKTEENLISPFMPVHFTIELFKCTVKVHSTIFTFIFTELINS